MSNNIDVYIPEECSLKELKSIVDELIAEHGEDTTICSQIDCSCDGWYNMYCTPQSHYHIKTFIKK